MSLDALSFRYPWRPYQERVLSAVAEHLDDRRLHIVAAPGAGKTTLGLEIFRSLGKNTLALSPTRVIRDQWIERLRDFCDIDDPKKLDWVSNSIHNPKQFTSITYQALHAQFAEQLESETEEIGALELDHSLNEKELNRFIMLIDQNKIDVLILDEAHHLRSEWWKALDKVCKHFPNIYLVSLTATPPYDSHGTEWARYGQLCGPIDEEISVPELVKVKTLCSHQDFIWCCDATAKEKQQIKEYDSRVLTFCDSLFENNEFETLVFEHRWLSETDIEAEVIKQPEIAISLLSFAQAKARPLNSSLMTKLDLSEQDIPELSRKWWQILVEAILFSKTTRFNEEQVKFVGSLKKQLRASELLNRREVSLIRSRRAESQLSLSSSKVDACVKIHKLEQQQRGNDLRQVFLTDYIRDENLNSELETGNPNLGAWPVFRHITSDSPIHKEVALLTGRLSILHTSKINLLYRHVEQKKNCSRTHQRQP